MEFSSASTCEDALRALDNDSRLWARQGTPDRARITGRCEELLRDAPVSTFLPYMAIEFIGDLFRVGQLFGLV